MLMRRYVPRPVTPEVAGSSAVGHPQAARAGERPTVISRFASVLVMKWPMAQLE